MKKGLTAKKKKVLFRNMEQHLVALYHKLDGLTILKVVEITLVFLGSIIRCSMFEDFTEEEGAKLLTDFLDDSEAFKMFKHSVDQLRNSSKNLY